MRRPRAPGSTPGCGSPSTADPTADRRGVGRYARHLLDGASPRRPGEVVETHRPRRADVYHSPWVDGALLRSPVPHGRHPPRPVRAQAPRASTLRTASRFRLRYLAVQRAVRVIVPTEAVAADVEEHLGIDRERIAVIPERRARSA